MNKKHLISGRLVSGIPFEPIDCHSLDIDNNGNSYYLNSYGKKIHYNMIIAVDKKAREMESLFDEINVTMEKQRIFTDYDDREGEAKEYPVKYCVGCYMIHISEPPPLVLISPNDPEKEWIPIDKCSSKIKTGDYIKVELELIPRRKGLPTLHFKPNFFALIRSGEEVDFKQDAAKKHKEMLVASYSKVLDESTAVPSD